LASSLENLGDNRYSRFKITKAFPGHYLPTFLSTLLEEEVEISVI